MKKIKLNKPSRKNMLLGLLILLIGTVGVYGCLSLRRAKQDITTLWIAMENVPGGNQAFAIAQGQNVEAYDDSSANAGVSYRIADQYVENVDVIDQDYNYKYDEEPRYIKKKVRVVEVEVVNNDSWVYTAYGNIGVIDNDGRILRSDVVSIKEEQDKNYTMNSGYGLELAPGGKGTMYLYFEDEGKEITRLYDIDSSTEITL